MSEQMDNIPETVTEEVKPVFTYAVPVKFKDAAKPYSFGTENPEIHKGDWVVVETAQGLEMGLCEGDAMEVEKYSLRMPEKSVVRFANSEDHYNYDMNEAYSNDAYDVCQEEIKALDLNMNLLSARYTLDRSKVLFIYLSDQRVDFRELLKKLGSRLRCRIELRQIGERDKAKLVGAIGMCGMECCCRRFKTRFDVISINMAKNQYLALNIDKLSGMCGKLMCCLKYEDQDYREMTEDLPKMGSQVEYEGHVYRITSMNVMNSEAKLESRDSVIFVSFEDLKEKAISRKGFVQKQEDRSDAPVQRTVHRREQRPFPSSRPERSEAPAAEAKAEPKKETRTFRSERNANRNTERNNERKQNSSDKPKNVEKRQFTSKKKTDNNNANKKRTETKTENRNVTVRTFKKKSSTEGENK